MPEPTPRFDFFISYAGPDQARALDLHAALERRGQRVFLDALSQEPTDRWTVVVPAALEASRTVVVLLSREGTARGHYDKDEVIRAVDLLRADRIAVAMVSLDGTGAPFGLCQYTPLPFQGDWAAIAEVLTGGAPRIPLAADYVHTRRLPWVGAELLGREGELALLDAAWANPGIHVLSVVAPGGIGKTALVSRWLGQQARKGFPDAARVYAWSFYSQGAGEGRQASGDLFVTESLKWFGDPDPMAGDAIARAERLARLVRQRPTLLILDGLEPLQHPPGPMTGRLKDTAVAAFLQELASYHRGLCLVTSREVPEDIADCRETTAPVVVLGPLSDPAGAALLRARGVVGEREDLERASREMEGHALALYLLGGLLARYCQGDVRRRDVVGRLEEARDRGNHARKVMTAYERWLPAETLAVWRLLGLFDRPAKPALIAALREPPLPGLTDVLAGFSERQWRDAVVDLKGLRLLSEEEDGSLDAHPLVREHLGAELRERDVEAWRAGHLRLYETLCASAKDQPDTLEEMEPLLQAIAHGCQGGRHEKALSEVLWRRAMRGDDFYLFRRLGAFASGLSVLAWYFAEPWVQPEPALSPASQAWIRNQAGSTLVAVGRLDEALGPLEAGKEMDIRLESWKNASLAAISFSQVCCALGRLMEARERAREAVNHAERSGEGFTRLIARTNLAFVLHQQGRASEARALFIRAEAMQAAGQPSFPILYSKRGYQYCDLLLGFGEATEVRQRAETIFAWGDRFGSLLDVALDHLLLGRVAQAIGDTIAACTHFNEAVTGLRKAGSQDELPRGLLARAAFRREQGEHEGAARDLAEATRISRRCGMRLFLADAALEGTRQALAAGDRAKALTQRDEAARLIAECGYHRRDRDLAALDAALATAGGH